MTKEQLADLEMRLAKGWMIHPDKIRGLIALARNKASAPPSGALVASLETAIRSLEHFASAFPGAAGYINVDGVVRDAKKALADAGSIAP